MRTAGAILATLARRLALGLLVIWLVATLTWVMARLAPGSTANILLGDYGDAEIRARLARAFGLDRPVWVQYLAWLRHLAAFDLGFSSLFRAPVAGVIAGRLPVTLALTLPALAISAWLSAFLGLAAGARTRSTLPSLLASAFCAAIPAYVVAQLLILVFALQLGWLPVQGLTDPRDGTTGAWDVVRHLVLPTLALTLEQLVMGWMFVRARVQAELRLDYVRTARAKGAGLALILRHHVWPNVALGYTHFVAARIGGLFAGAAVVENVFGLPGMGRLLVSAALARDVPLLAGIFLLTAALVVIANAIADALLSQLDPRAEDRRPHAA